MRRGYFVCFVALNVLSSNFIAAVHEASGNYCNDKLTDEDALQKILTDLGLEDMLQSFKEHLITLDHIKDLTREDFKELGFEAIGHRIQIQRAVKAYLSGKRECSYVSRNEVASSEQNYDAHEEINEKRYEYQEDDFGHSQKEQFGKPCPEHGKTRNGHWDFDTDGDKIRCILRCHEGFVASGCNVLRREGDKWNYDIPVCQEDSFLSKRKMACYTAAVAVTVSSPVLLYKIGFSSIGVVKGSIAAWLQGPTITAGSLFATFQSLGMTGLSKKATMALASSVAEACDTAFSLIDTCEKE